MRWHPRLSRLSRERSATGRGQWRPSRLPSGFGPLVVVGGALVVLLGLLAAGSPASTDGLFHIVLAGTVRASAGVPQKDGSTVKRVQITLRTSEGTPRLALAADQVREVLFAGGQTRSVPGLDSGSVMALGTLTGAATAIDPINGTPLFDLTVRGVVQPDGATLIGMTSPRQDTASHLELTLVVPANNTGKTLTLPGSGTITLAPDASAEVRGDVLGTQAAPQPSGTTGNVAGSATDDPTLWYVTRGAAATAYLLLAAVVALGISIGIRAFDGVLRGWRVLDLHRTLTLVMLAFIGLHLATLVLDPFKPFGLLQLVWPLAETYRPVWVALGVLSLYLLVAVTITSYLRRALGTRAWHLIHLSSYLAFIGLTAHGLLTGTDSRTPWMLALYFAACAVVLWLTLARIYFGLRASRERRATAAAWTRPTAAASGE